MSAVVLVVLLVLFVLVVGGMVVHDARAVRARRRRAVAVAEPPAEWLFTWEEVATLLPPDVLRAIAAGVADEAAQPVQVTINAGDTLETITARHGQRIGSLAWNNRPPSLPAVLVVYPARGGDE